MGDPTLSTDPLVSVYITNHNYARYLEQAVRSVVTQTLRDFDLTIIDDGSTDESRQIISRLADSEGIKVILQENRGLNVTNNIAIRSSHGKYVIRLDADDYLDIHALQLMAELMEREPNIGMVFSDYYHVDEHGRVIETIQRHDFTNVSLFDQPAHGAVSMIRRECLVELEGYDEQFRCQDGYELWIRFIKHYQVRNIQLPLWYYRRHEENLTNKEDLILQTRSEILSRERQRQETPLKVVGVIPIRGRSLDPFSSPLKKLGGKPLVNWTIDAALESARISAVVLTSPDEELLEYVRHEYGEAVLVYERDRKLALPNTHLLDTVMQAVDATNSSIEFDCAATLQIEYPFLNAQHIDMAVDTMEIFDVDSVIAVRPEQDDFFQHDGHGLTHIRSTRALRLEREDIFRKIGGLQLSKRTLLEKEKVIIGGRVGHVVVDKKAALDVRAHFDWPIAETVVDRGVSDCN
jgi:CMP-N-acetylneuraminic acid synthetase